MDRQQMIEEIQEKIADNTLSLGCRVYERYLKEYMTVLDFIDKNNIIIMGKDLHSQTDELDILGHPVSLSRVLSALDDCYFYHQGSIKCGRYSSIMDGDEREEICPRKLLKEDGSDAYLQDQSDETIQALHTLLVR